MSKHRTPAVAPKRKKKAPTHPYRGRLVRR